jgi:hypothetical protein
MDRFLNIFLIIVIIITIVLIIFFLWNNFKPPYYFIENRIQDAVSPKFSGPNENMRSNSNYAGGNYFGAPFLDTNPTTSILDTGTAIYGPEFEGF